MAWKLTTPLNYDPGHGKPAVTCTHIKACGKFVIELDDLWLKCTICYGVKPEGEAFKGIDATEENFFIRDKEAHQDYDQEGKIVEIPAVPAFSVLSGMAVSSAAGQLAWDVVANAVYGYLGTLSAAYAGAED